MSNLDAYAALPLLKPHGWVSPHEKQHGNPSSAFEGFNQPQQMGSSTLFHLFFVRTQSTVQCFVMDSTPCTCLPYGGVPTNAQKVPSIPSSFSPSPLTLSHLITRQPTIEDRPGHPEAPCFFALTVKTAGFLSGDFRTMCAPSACRYSRPLQTKAPIGTDL